ncbi:hypothetical protein [Siphonobacter sp. SORGH_AS_0500]|uniref:hypothetical protein n=1 Tax=Siphonobacter sp. SORGH_AS_0500 TaxID=1864824 RepID=UPI00285CA627|nr:hypothetical protein [Siphonobacter sp. SORGH_AS_0500]MDR6196152.1 hypothetical protein [Siphonobacter sp. SORGH_AS_0500]
MKNIICTGREEGEAFEAIDKEINEETARKVAAVPGAEHFGVWTAVFINGEFLLLSNYELDEQMKKALREA